MSGTPVTLTGTTASPPPPAQMNVSATTVTAANSPSAAAGIVHATGHSRESSEFEFLSESNSCSSGSTNASAPPALPTTSEAVDNKPAAAAVEVPAKKASPGGGAQESTGGGSGLLGWMKAGISGGGLLSKVQSSMETVITTLDPQMKEYIRSGGQGDPCFVVASDKADKVDPVRKAFQQVFGRATVFGVPHRSTSTIANQPVGFAAGRQAAQERMSYIKSRRDQDKDFEESIVVIAVEGFLLEVNDDEWVAIDCLALDDDRNGVSLHAYTQPVRVEAAFVDNLKESTPDSYPQRWSGFSKTIGQAIEESNCGATRFDWHLVFNGIPRSELIGMASVSLGYQYQRMLATKFGESSPNSST